MRTPVFHVTKNGVPILSKQDIDNIAEQLLQDFCPGVFNKPMPIDVDSFAQNYLGIEQDFQFLSHCGIYLGMMVFNDTNKIPVYNPKTKTAEYISAKARTVIIDNTLLDSKQEHRYRFTMGHESAHSILHTGYFVRNQDEVPAPNSFPAAMIQCRVDAQKCKPKPLEQWTDSDRMEWQANRFASALLMPKSMVMKLIQGISFSEEEFREAFYVVKTSRVFNVSCEAAKYRLLELGLIKRHRSLDVRIDIAKYEF
ncbi:ImmA/IrrE family metallo-endopeptidase [Acetanaerobacterium elongatum]|uniref:IrrE N-terminal-like domain-containing protein n=1 Tax=Acetanaerobacterium elongatum TaxID=258515 RepID=A0A1G9YC41_9FIRM|nr:ImmA/IrrE family metallo-endopeptidase [Acetanaerobacterium elongatum]SDN06607.1 protein of unknown function [Acetanaerobacterium elongatum]